MSQIVSGGVAYPTYMTMGAALRFKRASMREAAEGLHGLSDELLWLHCLASSACAAEGRPAPPELQEFADGITAEEWARWNAEQLAELQAKADAEGEKKSE